MVRPKRQQVCSGCGTPKQQHYFGPLGPNCEGEDVERESSHDQENEEPKSKDTTTSKTLMALTTAVRELSIQVNTIKKDQEDMKAVKNDISRKTCDSDILWKRDIQPEFLDQQTLDGQENTTNILPEKFVKSIHRDQSLPRAGTPCRPTTITFPTSSTPGLANQARFYLQQGLTTNTRQSYNTAQRQFLQFCNNNDLDPLPASEETLILFATFLANRIKPQSIPVYLAGVRSWHIENGYPNPLADKLRLKQTLRGISKVHHSPVKQKLPITFDILTRMKPLLLANSSDDLVVWAAMTTGHFLLLRSGEFVHHKPTDFNPSLHLTCSDVTFSRTPKDQEYMTVALKPSKTDQVGKGVYLYTGHSKHSVCAVCSMKSNLSIQSSRIDHTGNSALFTLSSGNPFTRATLLQITSNLLLLLGIDPSLYSGHSYRVGGATTAALAGLSDYEIRMVGRWSSDCYQRYIRSPLNTFLEIPLKLASTKDIEYQYANPFLC